MLIVYYKKMGIFENATGFVSYKDEPRPEYAPKKNRINKPRAARPPTVATIQRGILPISLILIVVIKK